MKRYMTVLIVWMAAMLFAGCQQHSNHSERNAKTEKRAVDHALVVALDASAENYACAKLKKENIEEIKRRYLNQDYLKKNGIDAIYTVVFSRNTEFVASVEKRTLPRMRDSVKWRKFTRFGHEALRMAIEKMGAYYSYKDENDRVRYYGKDIVGAIIKIVDALKNDKSAASATIVFASNMFQSVNKETVRKILEKEPIVLPDGYHIEALSKAYVCEDRYSALQIERHIKHNQEIWKRFVKPSENLRFRNNY